MNIFKIITLTGACLVLAACQSTPSSTSGSSNTYPGAHDVPSSAPKTLKIGRSYTIKGKRYHPHYNPTYSETGIASWYGPGFHGKKTANGETYNQYAMTAAHTTLPLPSIVRVTNLETGKSIKVRINDRGPFAHGRIIDLSKRAAQKLDIEGIKKVKVVYLKEETEKYWAKSGTRPRGLRGVDLTKYDSPQTSHADLGFTPSYSKKSEEPAPIMSVSSIQVADIKPSMNDSKAQPYSSNKYPSAPVSPYSKDIPAIKSRSTYNGKAVTFDRNKDIPSTKQSLFNDNANARGYFIQAGAFSSRYNAEKLQDKISHLGSVLVDEIAKNASTLYRVRVGPFASHSAASDNLHELFKIGIKDATVVAAK